MSEFAADCYADWADAARDQMREYVRRAALAMGGIALRTGLYAAGIEPEPSTLRLRKEILAGERGERALQGVKRKSKKSLISVKKPDFSQIHHSFPSTTDQFE